jgi:thiol-disulfide isomerase/thioredoxin
LGPDSLRFGVPDGSFPGMNRRAFSMLLLFACAAAPVAQAATPGEVRIGGTLPDATMRGLNGPSKNLSDFRGRPLLINVWASWCGPCRAEMASLERLAWMDVGVSFSVIGISTDDYPDKAKAALAESNATISHYIDSNLRLENMLGASTIPLTVLVDADGHVLRRIYGARKWDAPEALQLITETFGPGTRR